MSAPNDRSGGGQLVEEQSKRIDSIDHYRGLAIVLMVTANFINDIEVIPRWIRHAQDIGLGVIDFIAPMFVFAIGLTFGASFRRRTEKVGAKASTGHFIKRGLILIGIGSIWGAGEIVSGVNEGGFNWGALQALGVSILLTLPTLRFSAIVRILIGLLLLAGYQILLDLFWIDATRLSPHGGFQGSLGWSATMILATAAADMMGSGSANRMKGILLSAAFLASGLGLALWFVPIAMMRVTASYVLITLGMAGLIYALTRFLVDDLGFKVKALVCWGRNPLLLYIIHGFILALFVLPPYPWWHISAPLWLVIAQVLVLLSLMNWIARTLDKRRWYISI